LPKTSLHRRFNLTPFHSALSFCQDQDGRDVAVVLNRATFRLGDDRHPVPVEKGAGLAPSRTDVFWGEPGTSSLRSAAEVVPCRMGSDVAIIGHAYGRGKKVIEASFRVGSLEKLLMVQGPRCWAGGPGSTMAGPMAFDRLPLRYEHAYGGSCLDESGNRVLYLANPVGTGFAMAAVAQAPLPGFEYRNTPVRSVKDRPMPAGFGFIPTGWKPRADFAGTFDAAWMEARRPLWPKDFDPRFFNAVPPDQVVQSGIQGGEPVVLKNLHPRLEIFAFEIPKLAFSVRFHVKERVEEVGMQLDTLLVEPDEDRFSLTFRASLPLDDEVKFLKSILVDQVDPKA
jgi:hypothetical protein